MADDPNPPLSGALNAARDVLAPEIRGLADLATTSISAELRARVLDAQASRQRRDDLLAAALNARDRYIDALNALEDDGYPALPRIQVLASLLAEMQEEQSDLQAAVALFETERAASMAIGLGAPVDKASPELRKE